MENNREYKDCALVRWTKSEPALFISKAAALTAGKKDEVTKWRSKRMPLRCGISTQAYVAVCLLITLLCLVQAGETAEVCAQIWLLSQLLSMNNCFAPFTLPLPHVKFRRVLFRFTARNHAAHGQNSILCFLRHEEELRQCGEWTARRNSTTACILKRICHWFPTYLTTIDNQRLTINHCLGELPQK